jgi:hypothetical protein
LEPEAQGARAAGGGGRLVAPPPGSQESAETSESWSSHAAPGAAAASSWQWRSAGRRRGSSGRLLLPARRPACRCIRFQKQARLATIHQHTTLLRVGSAICTDAPGGTAVDVGAHQLFDRAGRCTRLEDDDDPRRREGRRLEGRTQLATTRAARRPHRRSREITNGSFRPPCQRWLSSHGTRRPVRSEPKGAGVLNKKETPRRRTRRTSLLVIEAFSPLFDGQ